MKLGKKQKITGFLYSSFLLYRIYCSTAKKTKDKMLSFFLFYFINIISSLLPSQHTIRFDASLLYFLVLASTEPNKLIGDGTFSYASWFLVAFFFFIPNF